MALLHIAARHPRAPLLGVAFSLGASIIARYLAEEGARSRLKAACVLGCVSRPRSAGGHLLIVPC